MKHAEPPPLDPDNPQTDSQRLPEHYDNADIPHVLARVRAFERFFRDHVDGKHPDSYTELYAAALDMLSVDLAPYALDLALSLITLEDRLRARGLGARPR
jgi:hypothetical protein